MRRTMRWMRLATVAAALCGPRFALAVEGPIGGVDLGIAIPVDRFWHQAHCGGVVSPFAGYMANDYLGLMGQLQVAGFPGVDDGSGTGGADPWALGAHAGPRLALPFGDGKAELYSTWQGGVFTGLSGNSAISRTSWGYSTGAGLNVRVSDDFLVGLFGRYNWLDQRVEGADVMYVTGAMGFTYNPAPPPPPPPPPAPEPPPPAEPVVKKKIVLRGVHFDTDKATIRADARPVLDEALATLRQESEVTVIAEGYTDNRGSAEYNQALSVRRARAVGDYLVAGGIAPSRIFVEGFGKTHPVASNDTVDGRAQNRRVELRIRDQ